MRTLKVLAAVALLSVVSAVSFNAGCWITESQMTLQNKKDFQAANMLGDIVGKMKACLGPKADSIYNYYVNEITAIDYIEVTPEELENYYFGW